MQKHFNVIEEVMKQQLNQQAFDEMGDPSPDCMRLIGRIININPEEGKLNEFNIGLLNLNEDNQYGVHKMKLNMSEVKSYSVFEGEVVVVDGFIDNTHSKLNVTRIHKPKQVQYQPTLNFEQMKQITY